jgi:hypothetical protein
MDIFKQFINDNKIEYSLTVNDYIDKLYRSENLIDDTSDEQVRLFVQTFENLLTDIPNCFVTDFTYPESSEIDLKILNAYEE